jgi:hypothetical protein
MTDQMPERRRIPRQKSLLRGKLYFNNRLNVVDCTIRDISDYGARLIYSEGVVTPDELELYIPQKDQTLSVKIVWRRGQEVGVVFEAAEPVNRPLGPDEIAERFARLEAEIAGLKRIIKKLKTDAGPDVEVA